MNKTIEVKRLPANFTVTVKLTNEFKIRVKIGIFFIKIGCLILGIDDVEVI